MRGRERRREKRNTSKSLGWLKGEAYEVAGDRQVKVRDKRTRKEHR